ncbi:MAG: hypothetical protein M1814_005732 [Vezdaea aestivalis]|nr:MAG: hypothetical protein M1814_005732 [Vezdaea aestivalis]
MHFIQTLLVGASAFALASAQLAFTSFPSSVEVGKTYTLTYSGGSGPVTILLRKGSSNDLRTIATLSSTATGGSSTWSPDASLPSGSDYALQITSGTETNYAGPIVLTGGSAAVTGTATASSIASLITSNSTLVRNVTAVANSTVTATTLTGNTTISTASLRATTASITTTAAGGASGTSGSSGTGATTAPTAGAGNVLKSSPLALILCAAVGLLYIN